MIVGFDVCADFLGKCSRFVLVRKKRAHKPEQAETKNANSGH